MVSSKAASHQSGSRVPFATIFSGKFLLPFVPGMTTRAITKNAKQKKNAQESMQHIQHSHLAERKSIRFIRQDQTSGSAQSTPPLAVAG